MGIAKKVTFRNATDKRGSMKQGHKRNNWSQFIPKTEFKNNTDAGPSVDGFVRGGFVSRKLSSAYGRHGQKKGIGYVWGQATGWKYRQ